jgi:hypothetical protein
MRRRSPSSDLPTPIGPKGRHVSAATAIEVWNFSAKTAARACCSTCRRRRSGNCCRAPGLHVPPSTRSTRRSGPRPSRQRAPCTFPGPRGVIVSVAGHPAPARIGADLFAGHDVQDDRPMHQQGQSVDQAIAWAERAEGYMRPDRCPSRSPPQPGEGSGGRVGAGGPRAPNRRSNQWQTRHPAMRILPAVSASSYAGTTTLCPAAPVGPPGPGATFRLRSPTTSRCRALAAVSRLLITYIAGPYPMRRRPARCASGSRQASGGLLHGTSGGRAERSGAPLAPHGQTSTTPFSAAFLTHHRLRVPRRGKGRSSGPRARHVFVVED